MSDAIDDLHEHLGYAKAIADLMHMSVGSDVEFMRETLSSTADLLLKKLDAVRDAADDLQLQSEVYREHGEYMERQLSEISHARSLLKKRGRLREILKQSKPKDGLHEVLAPDED